MTSAHLTKFAKVQPANIEWRDNLPYSLEFEDVYFSSFGGLEESKHVFIDGNQLESDWVNSNQATFFIAELGFGSGLNFLNTMDLWFQTVVSAHQNKKLHYISIEKRPLTIDDLKRAVENWPQLSTYSNQLINHYPSLTYGRHQIHFELLNTTLTLFFMPVEEALNDLIAESDFQQQKTKIDHWFLDGFSPKKNQSMWEESLCKKIASLSKSKTRLATFSVASTVKKALMTAGFKIKKRQGYGKKREMLTAEYQGKIQVDKKSSTINIKYEFPWFHYSLSEKTNRVAVIGGGIAGCTTAYQLFQQGLCVDIFEASDQLATGASGAAAGIFHPQLTSDINLSNQFSWLAYLYFLRFLANLNPLEKQSIILNQSVVRCLGSAKIKQQILNLTNRFQLGHWIKKGPLFSTNAHTIEFPHAAAINMIHFCQLLLAKIPHTHKQLFTNTCIKKIDSHNQQWILKTDQKEYQYAQVVYCGGAQSLLHDQLINFPTNTTRGQTCFIKDKTLAQSVNQTLCGQTYLVPKKNNEFVLGSTFENFFDDQLNQQSQISILNQTAHLLNQLNISFLSDSQIKSQKLSGTVGYRLHSQDRLPIIGAAINEAKLKTDFANLGQKQLKRKSLSYYNLPGLWLNTAYGSHGLLNALLASQHLVSMITNNVSPIQQQLSNALHPARFIIKKLKK